MIWTLGIDTASTQLDIGLLKDGVSVCSYSRFSAASHAEHITNAVSFFLNAHQLKASDIEHAGVTAGPGSFTGLRIGISFIKGFFLMRGAAIFPVSSLHAVAEGWQGCSGTFAVAFDARQGNVFSAIFRREKGHLRRLSDDVFQPVERFCEECRTCDAVLLDALGFKKSELYQRCSSFANLYLIERQCIPRGLAAAKIAWEAHEKKEPHVLSEDLLPRYLQESTAQLRMKKTIPGSAGQVL